MKLKFLRDLFTDATGETWAIGRIYSLPTLATGLSIPLVSIFRNQPVDMAGAGALLAGVAGAVLLLVRGANNVDLSDPTNPQPPKEPTP